MKCKKKSSYIQKKEDVHKYLEEGEHVYIRKSVLGINKHQNFSDDKKWLIIRRKEKKIYMRLSMNKQRKDYTWII